MSSTSVRAFVSAFRTHWLAAMSGGVSVPFTALAVFLDNKWAQTIFALLAFVAVWVAAFRIWKPERARVIELEETLRPKIKLLGIHVSPIAGLHSFNRNFDLELLNSSGQALDNCLVCVTDLRVEGDSAPTAYRRQLPLALLTARNQERHGGGPFHLRAGQNKKVPFCSREDGDERELEIHYEKNEPYFSYSLRRIKNLEVDLKIYGAPTPTEATLKLSVNTEGELEITIRD